MKKKLAAVLLSVSLCVNAVPATGAALLDEPVSEFSDGGGETDAVMEEDAAGPELFSEGSLSSMEMGSEEDLSSEDIFGADEEDESGEDGAFCGDDGFTEDVPLDFGRAEEDLSREEGIFGIDETAQEKQVLQRRPDNGELTAEEMELLAEAAITLDEGSVVISHWRSFSDGRWKLIKTVEDPSDSEKDPEGGGETPPDTQDPGEGGSEPGDQDPSEPGEPGSDVGGQDPSEPGEGGSDVEGQDPSEPGDSGSDVGDQDPSEPGEGGSDVGGQDPSESGDSGSDVGGQESGEPGEGLDPGDQDPGEPVENVQAGPEIFAALESSSVAEAPSGEGELLKAAEKPVYYTAEDGIVHIKTYQSVSALDTLLAEGDYFFDEEGYLVTGRSKVPAGTPGSSYTEEKEYFFMDSGNAKITDNRYTTPTPFNSNLGAMMKSYWLWTGKAFRYYSAKGGFMPMEELNQVKKDAGAYKGYYKINGKNYCLKSNGVPRQGFWDITDVKKPAGYYFLTSEESGGEIPGAMLQGGWRTRKVNGKLQWKYFQKNGTCKVHGVIATKLDTARVGDYRYLLDADGFVMKNAMAQGTGTKNWYISRKNGRIYTSGLVKYNGARYYIVSPGRVARWKNSWHRLSCASNRYYYFGSTPGKIQEKKGWALVKTANGKSAGWHYFPSNGNHYINKLTKAGRYFDSNGKLVAGVYTVNGNQYFFASSTTAKPNGVMYKSTWIHSKNKWYYANGSGVLYKNVWLSVGGYWHYFQNDCTLLTNSPATKNGVKGYLDSEGKFRTGWVVISNTSNLVKYVDPSTGLFAANKSLVINGLTYWFDSNGYRINDVTDRVSGPYYVEVDRVNGVMTIFNSARTIPVKSIRVSVGLPGTSTPTGRYTMSRSLRWQPLMGPSWGQYATHVDGAGYGGIFVHSVACSLANSYNLPVGEYYKLGSPASHGCIRCCVADSKWVYDHCNGSRIYIFDGTYKSDEVFKGPLGRRPLTPLRGSGNFDPTDPAVP